MPTDITTSIKKELLNSPVQSAIMFIGALLTTFNLWFGIKVIPILSNIDHLDDRVTVLEKIVSTNQPSIDDLDVVSNRQNRMESDIREIKSDIGIIQDDIKKLLAK